MGQQQLLLVILVTIIVGIATVVAINTFGSAADNANVDAVRQDIAQIGAAAQGYLIKPTALGGGGGEFTDITFNEMGSVPGDVTSGTPKELSNENGTYTITTADATKLTIKGVPKQAGGSIQADITKDNIDMKAYSGS